MWIKIQEHILYLEIYTSIGNIKKPKPFILKYKSIKMKNFTALIFLLIASFAYSQQENQLTQHLYNTTNINPAYAGARETTSVFARHRLQWVGINDAPVNTTASVNMPVGNNVGLGFSIDNEKAGPSVENNLSVDFSYTIPVFSTYKLSFGLKATAGLLDVDFNKLNIEDDSDYLFQNNIDNKFSPNIGLGLYLHSDNFYLGLSTPYLLETEHFDKYASSDAESYIINQYINFYLTAGHVFELNSSIDFKPALLIKAVKNETIETDLSANFLFHKKFTAGLNYRWDKSVGALIGFQATDSWFFGYTYDMETTELSNYNSGSHEFFLRWEFFNKNNTIGSSKFF
jgi:type IX secretion system PorP/SprF family membrane protein